MGLECDKSMAREKEEKILESENFRRLCGRFDSGAVRLVRIEVGLVDFDNPENYGALVGLVTQKLADIEEAKRRKPDLRQTQLDTIYATHESYHSPRSGREVRSTSKLGLGKIERHPDCGDWE